MVITVSSSNIKLSLRRDNFFCLMAHYWKMLLQFAEMRFYVVLQETIINVNCTHNCPRLPTSSYYSLFEQNLQVADFWSDLGQNLVVPD